MATIVLHPNQSQYDELNGYTNGADVLQFVLDGSGRYIVGLEVLEDPDFSAIYDKLNMLERVEYTPFPPPEMI